MGSRKIRTIDWLLAGVVFALGWAWLLGQNARVFERQPDYAVERLVADNVPVAFPAQLKSAELGQLCKGGVPRWAEFVPGAVSKTIAECLSDPTRIDEARAQALLPVWTDDLKSRIAVAHRWADEYDKSYPERRKALEIQLHRLQGKAAPEPGAPSDAAADPFSGDGILRTPPQGQAGRQLREHAANTQIWLDELLANQSGSVAERAAKVGLLIAGKRIQRDFGKNPTVFYLNSDTNSLAERMEWIRKAQSSVQDGLSLPNVHALLQGVLLASAVLLLVVAWLGMAVLPWALISLTLGIGALLVVDLGLAGDAAFRSFAFRQWGGDLVVSVMGVALWWPLLVVALLLVLVRHPFVVQSPPAKVLGRLTDRIWVQWGHSARWGWAQMVLLLAMGFGILAFPGFGATKSELIIALGCVALATFLAREASLASVGTGVWSGGLIRHWLRQEVAAREKKGNKETLRAARGRLLQVAVAYSIVGVGLAVALGASIVRGDLGHALVATGMAAVFFWLFAGQNFRGVLALVFLGVLLVLGAIYFNQSIPSSLESFIRSVLPYHAQERFVGMVSPLDVTASDMARIRWLMQSAGATGWGSGWVPWSGLGEVRLSDGVPLQGPSDYVPALLVAQWGAIPGSIILLTVLGLFVVGAVVAGRTALAQGVSQSVRLLAGIGLFGCVLMAFKVVLSLGGVTGVLPLTGLPVALVGYGIVSTLVGLLYLALAFGTRHHRVGSGVQLRAGPVLRGPLVQRGRALVAIAALATVLLTLASLARMNAPLSGKPTQAACDPPVSRDINGQPIEVAALIDGSTKTRAHCSGTAYRLTEALKRAVQAQPLAAAPDSTAATTGLAATPPATEVAAITAPAVPTDEPPTDDGASDEGFVDPEGGPVSLLLETERQAMEAEPPTPMVVSGSYRAEVCPEMTLVLAAWNERVAELKGKGAAHLQTFDAQALYASLGQVKLGWQTKGVCRHRARELGILLQSSLPSTLAAGGRPAREEAKRYAAFFEPTATKAAARADFETPNAWRGLPGCIVPVGSLAAGRTDRKCNAEDRDARLVPVPGQTGSGASGSAQAANAEKVPLERAALNNYWLQQQLAGRLGGVKGFSDESLEFEWRRHRVQAGPVAGLTLDPKLQDLAQRIVECYTGQRRGAEQCAGVLPANSNSDQAKTYFGVGAKPEDAIRMRAGAMGLVLAEVDSGRVVAFANAISDCSLKALATRQAYASASKGEGEVTKPVFGRLDPADKQVAPCSLWPDQRRQYMALQAPALWMVPPGSSLKPLVVQAGVEAGKISASEKDKWRAILAYSHDQRSIQIAAVDAAPTYRDVLRYSGFDLGRASCEELSKPYKDRKLEPENAVWRDLLWGGEGQARAEISPKLGSRWSAYTTYIGNCVGQDSGFVPWRLPVGLTGEKFYSIYEGYHPDKKHKKLSEGQQVQRHGRKLIDEYSFANSLGQASIGGGDIRASAMGLVSVWRALDLRARGAGSASSVHMLEAPDIAVPTSSLEWSSKQAAEIALYATSGVTSKQLSGTAATACATVFGKGSCDHVRGLSNFWGKTGTADFNKGPVLIEGAIVPSRFFGGVFVVDGKRYAFGTMGLRTRNVAGELDTTSAPAEATLTLLREMQRVAASANAPAAN